MGLARFVFSWLLAILHSPRCSLWICWSFCPRTLPLTLSFDLLNCLSCLLGSFLDPQEGLGAFLQALKDICFPLSLPGWPKIVWSCLLLLTSLWYRKFLYYYIPSTPLVPGIASGVTSSYGKLSNIHLLESHILSFCCQTRGFLNSVFKLSQRINVICDHLKTRSL